LLRQLGKLPTFAVLDGLMLLGIFLMPPLLLVGWALSLILFYMGNQIGNVFMLILVISTYNTLGNFATFFEVASATRLDGSGKRILLLPFLSLGFLVSFITVSWATISQIFSAPFNNHRKWDKTDRYRNGDAGGNDDSAENNYENGRYLDRRHGYSFLIAGGCTIVEHIFGRSAV
jgi:hypothetical protein